MAIFDHPSTLSPFKMTLSFFLHNNLLLKSYLQVIHKEMTNYANKEKKFFCICDCLSISKKVKNYNLNQWVYSHTDTNLLSIRIGKVVELLFFEVGNIAIQWHRQPFGYVLFVSTQILSELHEIQRMKVQLQKWHCFFGCIFSVLCSSLLLFPKFPSPLS